MSINIIDLCINCLLCQEDTATDISNDDSHDDTGVTETETTITCDTPDPVVETSPIEWNYDDLSKYDHRVRLWCELSLFREEEDLLLMVKGQIYVRSQPGKDI